MARYLGTLRIKDRRFKVTKATLSGKVKRSGPVEWFLEVDTMGKGNWDPRGRTSSSTLSKARTMDQFLASPIVIKKGAKFCENRILPGCRLCCLYVFEHSYTDDNRIQFDRAKGNKLKMVWTAKCAVYENEDYWENLELKIETLVDFLGLAIEADDEDGARKLVTKKFDPRGLRFHREADQEGSYFLPIPGKW